MKMILLAASVLALGGVAQAQDTTQPPMTTPAPSGSSAGAPGTAAPADPAMSAPAAAPADPAMAAPASAPMSSAPADTTAAAASTDDSNLPVCSKSVTDKCKQGGGMHHGKMHHKMK